MWEQLIWLLVSIIAAGIVVAPFPKKNRTVIEAAGRFAIGLPFIWMPFTSQPKLSGVIGLVFIAIGISLFVGGIALSGRGYRAMRGRGAWKHADPTAVVKEGPYHFVRHPIYVGFATAALGWTLAWGGVYAILLIPFFYLLLGVGAWMEERQLLRMFGDAYESYRKEVPSFFPVVLGVPLAAIAVFTGLGILLSWIPLV